MPSGELFKECSWHIVGSFTALNWLTHTHARRHKCQILWTMQFLRIGKWKRLVYVYQAWRTVKSKQECNKVVLKHLVVDVVCQKHNTSKAENISISKTIGVWLMTSWNKSTRSLTSVISLVSCPQTLLPDLQGCSSTSLSHSLLPLSVCVLYPSYKCVIKY
jgi:hypothetical protein